MDGEGREVLFVLVNPPADFEVRKPDILKRLTGLTPKDLMLPSAMPFDKGGTGDGATEGSRVHLVGHDIRNDLQTYLQFEH